MVKNFLKSSFYYLFSKLFASGVNLIVFAYAARRLELNQMGYYAMLSVSVLFLGFFMTLEIQSGFMRYYVELKTKAEKDVFEHSIINLLLVSNLTMGILLFIFKPVIEKIFVPIENGLFAVLIAIPFATVIANLYVSKLKLENRYKTVAIILIGQSLVYGAVVAGGIYFSADVIFSLITANLIQQVFILILYAVHLKRVPFIIYYPAIRESVKFSAILVPTVFGIQVSNLSAKYIAGKVVSIASAGIYEILNKVSSMMILLTDPLYQAFTPIIYSNYKDPAFRKTYYTVFGINLLVLLWLVLFFSVFNTELIELIGGKKYLVFAHYSFVFILIAALQIMSKLFEVNIYLAEKGKFGTLIELIVGSLMVFFSFYSSLEFGLEGIILAILGVYIIRFLLYMYYSNRLFSAFYMRPWVVAAFLAVLVLFMSVHFYTSSMNFLLKGLLLATEVLATGFAFLRIYRVSPSSLVKIVLKKQP